MLAYVVRHAESLSNVDPAAGLNSGLSTLGERQAEALAERLRAVPLRAIYCSPFARCIATARALTAGRDLPIRVRPDLCEHHHLSTEAKVDHGLEAMEDLARQHGDVVACPDYPAPFVWVPTDESRADLVARIRCLAAYLKERWTGEDDAIVVLGHGSPIARLIEAWIIDQPGPSFRFMIDNCAINALRFCEGVSSLVCLNEVSHLHGLAAPSQANYTDDGQIKPRSPSSYW
jgi:broad specificity phosphatase PhoE